MERRMHALGAEAAVGRLREHRVRPEPDQGLAPVLAQMQKDFRRQERRQAGVGAAWDALVPPELRARATVEGVDAGTLRVSVDDSAAAYLFDRWLRSGGERLLVEQAAADIRRVRVKVGGSAARKTSRGR